MADAAIDLRLFFEALETDFPLSGVRAALSKRVGEEATVALERAGIVTFLRHSETYPCPSPGGAGCPRQVVHLSGEERIEAVCGNEPPECDDIELTAKDIEVVGVVPQRLCEALRGALLFGGKTERLPELEHVFRAGTLQPLPGVRKAVYFAARCLPKEYGILLELLRSRHGSEGFALLVPTDRYVSEETVRESALQGIVVQFLADIIGMDASNTFVVKVKPEELFAGIGRIGPGPIIAAKTVYVQVRTRDGWGNLDQAGYQALLRNREQYDIIADERTKEIRKRVPGKSSGRKAHETVPPLNVPASHFQIIRKAIGTRGYFDPTIEEEIDSGKQIFQRARQAFDIKYANREGKTNWKLFKTITVGNRAVYQFQPDEGVTFALIFLPQA